MSQETVDQLDQWRAAALEQWTDTRIVDPSWVDVHIWFFLHAYADLAEHSLVMHGFSLRESYAGWLLVVKATQDDVPLVAFVSGENPTSCMRQFRRGLRETKVNWTKDKFA